MERRHLLLTRMPPRRPVSAAQRRHTPTARCESPHPPHTYPNVLHTYAHMSSLLVGDNERVASSRTSRRTTPLGSAWAASNDLTRARSPARAATCRSGAMAAIFTMVVVVVVVYNLLRIPTYTTRHDPRIPSAERTERSGNTATRREERQQQREQETKKQRSSFCSAPLFCCPSLLRVCSPLSSRA